MVGGEDLLFRPIMYKHGMYRAESLVDGTIDLELVMLCNEAIDVEIENERRAHAARQNEG